MYTSQYSCTNSCPDPGASFPVPSHRPPLARWRCDRVDASVPSHKPEEAAQKLHAAERSRGEAHPCPGPRTCSTPRKSARRRSGAAPGGEGGGAGARGASRVMRTYACMLHDALANMQAGAPMHPCTTHMHTCTHPHACRQARMQARKHARPLATYRRAGRHAQVPIPTLLMFSRSPTNFSGSMFLFYFNQPSPKAGTHLVDVLLLIHLPQGRQHVAAAAGANNTVRKRVVCLLVVQRARADAGAASEGKRRPPTQHRRARGARCSAEHGWHPRHAQTAHIWLGPRQVDEQLKQATHEASLTAGTRATRCARRPAGCWRRICGG